jgi:UPF0755 protein
MSRRARWLSAAGCTGLLALAAAGWIWHAWTSGPATVAGAADVRLRVEPGQPLTAVADTLVARGLLDHPRLFRWWARLTGRDRELHAGLYEIPRGTSPRGLLRRLVAGRTVPVVVTLPEGISAEAAAARLAATLDGTAEDFLTAADSLVASAVRSRGWLAAAAAARYDSLLAASGTGGGRRLHWCEGYLAPDTYHFAEGTDAVTAAQALVDLQLARIDSVATPVSTESAELGLSIHDLVTLASIVEAEARHVAEQRKIAAVYVNRLRRGWRLEADPTVAYFLDKRGERLLYRDLARPSPWNTYRHVGIPPGPILNPGLSALAAAARPDRDCTALYFVADGDGGHVFSETAEQHEAAVRRYRRLRDGRR